MNAESASSSRYAPYKDSVEDDEPIGIQQEDVTVSYAQDFGYADLHHVCSQLLT